MEAIKIYNMDDCTWIAAANLEDAWRGFADFLGYGIEEVREDSQGFEPEELTDEDLDRLKYHLHDLGDYCPSGDLGDENADCPVTFREQLERMKRKGAAFPCFFATTEY